MCAVEKTCLLGRCLIGAGGLVSIQALLLLSHKEKSLEDAIVEVLTQERRAAWAWGATRVPPQELPKVKGAQSCLA